MSYGCEMVVIRPCKEGNKELQTLLHAYTEMRVN